MHQALKDAGVICKTLMRNGYDAHIINAPLQEYLIEARKNKAEAPAIDIACEVPPDAFLKLFPKATAAEDPAAIAQMETEGARFYFYPIEATVNGHPELSLLRVSPGMAQAMAPEMQRQMRLSGIDGGGGVYEGFADFKDGSIRLLGIPDETLRRNYLLAVRALRFAANFDVPIEPNTWMAIVRASVRVLDYVPVMDIMEEWRKVAAESMHLFVKLLYDSHLLQGLMPEIAALACVTQQNDKGEINGNVFEHTLKCMRFYPQENFHYDWLGTMAMLFHDVGKLYTAEYFNGRWTYFQHHRVSAQVTRKILRRVHFDLADIDLICHLVQEHMRFHFMMTDRGIRRFKSLGETERLIAIAKADLLAREDSFTSFNHNIKYLERAETPEQLLEPLLNGNEIMSETRLEPGRLVGIIRAALLEAQQNGDVSTHEEALAFVRAAADEIRENPPI